MEEKTDLNKNFLILFWGNFIPLQGIQYIVLAAKKIEKYPDIKFQIIGGGQTEDKIHRFYSSLNIKNVEFLGKRDSRELPSMIKKADICLGIFGDTDKAARVIPNKIYEAIAMAKPVITADTSAIRELFTDKENILLCRRADSEDLAEKISELKNDSFLRGKIAKGGYELFQKHALPAIIGRQLLEELAKYKIL